MFLCKVCKFQGQCYHKLKRSCLRRGALFQDPFFPPSAESLFYKRTPPPGLMWKRPRVRESDSELSLSILNVFVLIVNFVHF
uniref:Calpain catalytic domain-containing protein n=1 Tax=Sinocyclocheilus grahami TaxID=75366 RepID=A0A672JWN8_SINGR